MNIAFCDDNSIILNNLKNLIEDIINKYNIYDFEFNYFCYTDPYELLKEHNNKMFDIAFLDIDMPKRSGFDLGDEVFALNENIFIFYVTSYENFMANSIKHRVYRFICKDNLEELHEGIKSVLRDLAMSHTRYNFSYKNHSYSIPLMNINYFESSHNCVKIITCNETFLQRTTIKKLSKELPEMFQQCHAGFIVNTFKIKKLSADNITLDNNQILPFSRKHRLDLLLSINRDKIAKFEK